MSSPPPGFNVRQRTPVSARARQAELPPQLQKYVETGEVLVAEPFRGITTGGPAAPGLFPIKKTGVSTRQITDAARAFVDSLSEPQRERVLFPLESDVWRRWSNIHPFLMRHGLSLDEMSPAQRERALALLRESLSAQGFKTARDVMRLNELVRTITGSQAEYGEWLYWLSVMGVPSFDGPWGWQIDGHHLNINCFVLGDQLVMTPTFMGSEPVLARFGKYKGTRVFAAEEEQGYALMRALSGDERQQATIGKDLPSELLLGAFQDNRQIGAAGIRYDALSAEGRERLEALLGTYTGRMRHGHGQIHYHEAKRHLSETHFAWIGPFDDASPFYYRILNPVILVEFDHQSGIVYDNDTPSRDHIHTVVRTPNGNDYGRDLLRRHYAQHDHSQGLVAHGHKEA